MNLHNQVSSSKALDTPGCRRIQMSQSTERREVRDVEITSSAIPTSCANRDSDFVESRFCRSTIPTSQTSRYRTLEPQFRFRKVPQTANGLKNCRTMNPCEDRHATMTPLVARWIRAGDATKRMSEPHDLKCMDIGRHPAYVPHT